MKKFLSILLILSLCPSLKAQKDKMMTEVISTRKDAPVIVLFGGNPHRRDEVLKLLMQLGDFTIYGTLSEEEGISKINSLPKVDLVLIGGRYDHTQRTRIRAFVAERLPNAKLTEPGWEYPYNDEAIRGDVKAKLGLN